MVKFSRRLKGKWLLGLCLVLALLCSMAGAALAADTEDAADLPHIAKWVNGMAVSDEGEYLSDTWAVDDTGVSERVYVLVGQGYTEEMRVERYPEDITDGETMPCPKYYVSASLVLPEGVSGDVLVEIESSWAVYSVVFQERAGYTANLELYPGVYRFIDVELTGDVDGTYVVSNCQSFDAASDKVISLDVKASDESHETQEGATKPSDGADVSNGTTAESNGNDGGSTKKDNGLLIDTVKLVIVVSVLLVAYTLIKHFREKKEEKQY